MARSVWKGPFVEESLMKKVDKKWFQIGYLCKSAIESGLSCDAKCC